MLAFVAVDASQVAVLGGRQRQTKFRTILPGSLMGNLKVLELIPLVFDQKSLFQELLADLPVTGFPVRIVGAPQNGPGNPMGILIEKAELPGG
jgi:hypothetical protein